MKVLPLLAFLAASIANAQPHLALQRVIGGLNQPDGIVQAGDSRLFIVQQPGQIMIFDGTRILPTPFLDVRSLISCCGERGLLGLAFHPDYRANGLFFIDYTNTGGNITVARYHVSSDPDRADSSSAVVLLTIVHSTFSNHNGGELQFGPNGSLYIGTGDGGSSGDPFNNAQTRSALLGKILRIDVNASTYVIPPSNPFGTEVWAYGLRNPWRFSFDRMSGDLWIADVGQDRYEEVDLQPATTVGGENYGWRKMEGLHCYNPSTNCHDSSMTLPILEYSHDDGSCAITGGYRYRGTHFPRMSGMYFYGDYCTGSIWGAAQQSDGSWTTTRFLPSGPKITSFGEDLNGELYLVAEDGALYRLIDQSPLRRRAVSK